MGDTDVSEFPVLFRVLRPAVWQRSLNPLETPTALLHSFGPSRWAAEQPGRIIDSDRRLYRLTFDGSEYGFRRVDESVSDEELRELMRGDFWSRLRSSSAYLEEATKIEGCDLFRLTFRNAQKLPDLSMPVRFGFCLLIILLCTLAMWMTLWIGSWITR